MGKESTSVANSPKKTVNNRYSQEESMVAKIIRVTVAFVVIATLIVGFYFWRSRRHENARAENSNGKITEYTKIVNTDLVKNYPKTPRAVVNWYSRIITEYYAKDHTDKEIEKLADQARAVMDPELKDYNPKEAYYKNVKADIKSYKDRSARIIAYDLENSNYIEYKTVQGYECAYVMAYYSSKEGSSIVHTYQNYCLRKDEDGRWKILTWEKVEGDPDYFD